MNKRFEQERATYPEVNRRKVFATPDDYAIDRAELRKTTDRQSYTVTWYIVTHHGKAIGAWKSKSGAIGQIVRKQSNVRRGRPPKDRTEEQEIERIVGMLKENPKLLDLLNVAATCTDAQIQAVLDLINPPVRA